MAQGPPAARLAGALERIFPAWTAAGESAQRQQCWSQARWLAAEVAAARGQLQSAIAAALIEMGDFEVVDGALTFSSVWKTGFAS